MKRLLLPVFGLAVLLLQIPLQAEGSDPDDSLIIRKGSPSSISPAFQVIDGETEIAGDPAPNIKGAYDNWKQACKDWKKETKDDWFKRSKDDNAGGQIISISCGVPQMVDFPNAQRVYKSMGKYKARVRIRDSGHSKNR